MHANDLTEEDVVVIQFDEEQTDLAAYNIFAKHIAHEFRPYDFEMGPSRTVYAQDVSPDPAEVAIEWVYFVVKEMSVLVLYEYIRRNFIDQDSEEGAPDTIQDITIKTGGGDVVIEEMKLMSAREAKEVTGHFEHLAEHDSLERYYGDDDEIMAKYGGQQDEYEESVDESEEG